MIFKVFETCMKSVLKSPENINNHLMQSLFNHFSVEDTIHNEPNNMRKTFFILGIEEIFLNVGIYSFMRNR